MRRLSTLSGLLWRSKGWREDRILRSLSQIHPDAKVHPTAVIEASRFAVRPKPHPVCDTVRCV